MTSPNHSQFQAVQETNKFLALFPHRHDYIWAESPLPGQSPDWKTESRHPLSDRLIQQGAYLYGVRFGAETQYCLLDIDAASLYHPNHDPLALSRIAATLEPLGLVSYLACTSSYSGGLHLYFPFPIAQSSWHLAIAVSTLLENAGFKLLPGQLEVFPNPRPYVVEGQPSLFNAHRLPLQIGSYLLNQELQPIWGDQQSFVRQWEWVQSRNAIDTANLKYILKLARRRRFAVSGKADKFINDLNAEIEAGWTGHGQTNRLLGRITLRTYIFHHVLNQGEPLAGQALVDEIVKVATALPGYQEWCRHQHEIEHRAKEWVRCIENSHYYRYGDSPKKAPSNSETLNQAIDQAPNRNQQRSAAARDRIRAAIADLLEQGNLPSRATARFHALLEYGIGGGSLYRYRDLWHPSCLGAKTANAAVETSDELACPEGTANCHKVTSLFLPPDGNTPPELTSSDFSHTPEHPSVGNSAPEQIETSSPQGIEYVLQALAAIKAQQEARQEANRMAHSQRQQLQQQASQAKVIARMRQYLTSGDPILVAEALAWAQINPGILDLGSDS